MAKWLLGWLSQSKKTCTVLKVSESCHRSIPTSAIPRRIVSYTVADEFSPTTKMGAMRSCGSKVGSEVRSRPR
eukprot:20834-Alexandrium_andersonii.AAC.2